MYTIEPPTKLIQPYAHRHTTLNGPGDDRPTALEILKDLKLDGKLKDKTVLITGATTATGLGVATAKALHTTGARIFIAARDKEKADAAITACTSDTANTQPIEAILMDLADFSTIRCGVEDFLQKSKTLNVLINNAGVMYTAEGRTKDGLETVIGVNHFAHFYLFQLLKSTLLASSSPSFHSRVINVTSSAHRYGPLDFDNLDSNKGGYNKAAAYFQSKTANIYMANGIETHYGDKGLHGLSIHPGGVLTTQMFRHLNPEDYAPFGDPESFKRICKTADQGAATIVWAALAPVLEGKGALYLDDVGIAGVAEEGEEPGGPGYSPHAYDGELTEKLWKYSCEAVGVEDD